MSVSELECALRQRTRKALQQRIAFILFFGALVAYTLTTMDGGDIAPGFVSAAVLLMAAICLAFPIRSHLKANVPIFCLLFMVCYGIAQTLWFRERIAYDGWSGVLFWSGAAAILFLSMQILSSPQNAARFRLWFVFFGSALCVLDLLEQASHTSRYFWLIPSRYPAVNGSFAYWNNFAQFVELLLPVTLWLAVSRRKPAVPYLVLSGLQIGAVVASGSRAGSALVIIEFVAVMVIAWARNRNRTFLVAAGSALALTLLFVYAAGLDVLSHKLEQRDQLAIRREINASSVEMIRRHPFTGWGLGTYVPVYRMFARYDDGTYVNRAHDDWLEWTAEGGIFFSAAMLVVFFWSIRPAIRSVWGIGVLALCLHALVDYPFARLGVCGWYFAFIGILVTMSGEQWQRETSHTAERASNRRSALSTS